MSQVIDIRPARPPDAAAIACVHVDTWRSSYPGIVPKEYLVGMTEARQAVQWDAMLRRLRPPETVLVAEAHDGHDTLVVGFGSCGRARVGPCAGEVYTLYVASDWQNQGIGRHLLAGLFSGLVERDINDALVWVLSANPSRYFYEALGGTRISERSEAFAGQMLDETAYGWPDLAAWLAAQSA